MATTNGASSLTKGWAIVAMVVGLIFPGLLYAATTTVVTDPVGEKWDYTFDQNLGIHNLVSKTSQTDGKGIIQQFDINNNLISITDEEGRTTDHTYNGTNQRISTTEAAGTVETRTTTFEYVSTDVDLPTRVTTPSVYTGAVREVLTAYDANLNVTSVTINGFQTDGTPVSRNTAFQYNSAGQVTRINGPRTDVNDVTTLTYYGCNTGTECGRLADSTNALGHTTTYDSYNAHGQVTQSTDPLGVVTTYSYDLRNRVTSITQAPPTGTARTTTFAHDSAGQLTSMTTPESYN